MDDFCYYLCLCGCFGLCCRRKYVKREVSVEDKKRSMKTLNQITRRSPQKSPISPSPQSIQIDEELTFKLGQKFRTDDEVLANQGYSIGSFIGSGQFADVYRATDNKHNKTVAVKVSVFPAKDNEDRETKKQRKQAIKAIQKELFVFKTIIHPHIIRMLHYFFVVSDSRNVLYLFMQLGQHGDMSTFLKKKGPFDENTCRLWLAQMLSALVFCHSKKIAHRDLKLSNILLDDNEDVLISDFGLCQVVPDGSGKPRGLFESKTYCGTGPYMAPELVEKKLDIELENKTYDPFAVDVWALGVVLYVLLTSDYPFDTYDKPRALKNMRRRKIKFNVKNIKESLSSDCQTVIKEILNPNIKDRPTMESITKFQWIRDQYLIVEDKCKKWMKNEKKRKN